MDRQIAHAIGLQRPLRIRFQEGVDYVLGRLEGARGVEGQIATIVHAGGLLWE